MSAMPMITSPRRALRRPSGRRIRSVPPLLFCFVDGKPPGEGFRPVKCVLDRALVIECNWNLSLRITVVRANRCHRWIIELGALIASWIVVD